ncbi:hypothetical protein [Streptomyces sp. NPDC005262]|uniref:effector-associated constant component EACC1 n=1 Tax=Streptomyces sp. NPDC005262 TaxID=3364710 RepID=UPI00369CE4FD
MHPTDEKSIRFLATLKEAEPHDFIESLQEWLTQDAEASQSSTIELANSVKSPENMSGSFDTILAVAGQMTGLGSLILAYLTWRKTMSQSVEVTPPIRVRAELNGMSIEIDGMSDTQITAFVSGLQRDEIEMPNVGPE